MTDTATFPRRAFLRRASGLVLATAGGLVLPGRARAEGEALCPYCGVAPFGPLHAYLHRTGPDPIWMDRIIARESSWHSGARNPWSDAAGLCQFIFSTWQWGEERFGIYGSPYDPYTAIDMFSAFVAADERYHWSCGGAAGCEDV